MKYRQFLYRNITLVKAKSCNPRNDSCFEKPISRNKLVWRSVFELWWSDYLSFSHI